MIVVLFFLLLFVMAHFFLGTNLNSKNNEIVILNNQMDNLIQELNLEKKENINLKNDVKNLNEISLNLKNDLENKIKENEQIYTELSKQIKSNENFQKDILFLTNKTTHLNSEIEKLNDLLKKSEEDDKKQKAQIADLGKQLNKALAKKASELAYYRSNFFGTLRKILKDREDIIEAGDRFIFQSELFFKSGSDDLEDTGKENLKILAKSILELEKQIPNKINWVLRVDGHTDNIPISNEKFASNWHLSVARSISVIQYLIELGVNPRRLVATGFGEYQPVDKKNTQNARKKNRRIEFKLTEK
ncbi:MAG: peptidoglycan-binding protein [Alphaproteobacteria bacterium]|nr:peptidoglycan-binding protein [Alphaproteobacteria bacterium]